MWLLSTLYLSTNKHHNLYNTYNTCISIIFISKWPLFVKQCFNTAFKRGPQMWCNMNVNELPKETVPILQRLIRKAKATTLNQCSFQYIKLCVSSYIKHNILKHSQIYFGQSLVDKQLCGGKFLFMVSVIKMHWSLYIYL